MILQGHVSRHNKKKVCQLDSPCPLNLKFLVVSCSHLDVHFFFFNKRTLRTDSGSLNYLLYGPPERRFHTLQEFGYVLPIVHVEISKSLYFIIIFYVYSYQCTIKIRQRYLFEHYVFCCKSYDLRWTVDVKNVLVLLRYVCFIIIIFCFCPQTTFLPQTSRSDFQE